MSAFDRAWLALNGLSVGDAFGEQFFIDPEEAQTQIEERRLPAPPWTYTDDTEMALSIVAVLRTHGGIEQDMLVQSFAAHCDPQRGYGPTTRGLLARIREGEPWTETARSLFGGAGSLGNGAAMRAAPIGGYFADNLEAVVYHARLSAEVTHHHPEGIAEAIAVASAAALAWQLRNESSLVHWRTFLGCVLPYVPDSLVREKIRHARNLQEGASVRLAVAALGNGMGLSAPDTVPFALWCAAQHLNDYAQALWLTVSGLGDRDTTCAIVGGIVALHVGADGVPTDWLQAREPLPSWAMPK